MVDLRPGDLIVPLVHGPPPLTAKPPATPPANAPATDPAAAAAPVAGAVVKTEEAAQGSATKGKDATTGYVV